MKTVKFIFLIAIIITVSILVKINIYDLPKINYLKKLNFETSQNYDEILILSSQISNTNSIDEEKINNNISKIKNRINENEFIRDILNEKIALNSLLDDKINILILACQRNDHELINLIYDKNIDYNFSDENGRNAIYHAILFNGTNSKDIVSKIIKKIDITHKDNNGNNILEFVANLNNIEIFKHIYLLSLMNISSFKNLAHFVVINKNIDALKFLLSQKYNIETLNDSGENILHLSLKNNLIDFATEIINYNPNLINTPNKNGDSPLHIALNIDNLEIVNKLIAFNANIDLINNNYETVLMKSLNSKNIDIKKLILDKSSNINSQNIFKQTALMLAISNNDLNMVNNILSKNPNLEIKDNKGQTALFYSINHPNINILIQLIQKKANLFHKNNENINIFELCKKNNVSGEIYLLIKSIYDKNTADKLFNEAINNYTNKKYNDAKIKLDKVIELDPKNYDAYFYLSLIADINQNLDDSLSYIKKLLVLKPDYRDPKLSQIITNNYLKCLKVQNYNEVIILLSISISFDPNNDINYYNRGVAYLKLSDYTNAANDFNKCISLNKNNINSHFNLATAYVKLNNYNEALNSLLYILSLNPYNTDALAFIGDIYMLKNNTYEAAKYYLKIREIDIEKFDSLPIPNDYKSIIVLDRLNRK